MEGNYLYLYLKNAKVSINILYASLSTVMAQDNFWGEKKIMFREIVKINFFFLFFSSKNERTSLSVKLNFNLLHGMRIFENVILGV